MPAFFIKFRRVLYKVCLVIGQFFYKITFGMFPASMFYMSVDSGHINTDVKIVKEDEDSVTIAKFNEYGVMKNENFKIISTSDLHLGDDPKLRKKAFQLLANHITNVHPDLVVFTGDIILSKFQQIDTIQFARFMEKIGVYWTIVFGNHEAREDRGYFKKMMIDTVASYPHCLTRIGPDSLFGYGNYCINIQNGENRLQQSLFFFDSGRDILDRLREEYQVPEGMNGYDFLKKEQIGWYKDKILALREQYGDFKSMMYMHIPLPEYQNAIETQKTEDGAFPFTDKCRILYGAAYEGIGCSQYNSGMFAAIKEMGSTQAVFSGHDHINDFCALYDGVYLVYNQCCGYETYTMGTNYGWEETRWPQGVTVTLIHSDGSFELAQRLNTMYLKETIAKKKAAAAKAGAKKK